MVNVGIVGATGMVGRNFLKVMEERNFPVDKLYLFASAKSKGKKIVFNNKEFEVEELNEHSFDKPMDIALFSAGGKSDIEISGHVFKAVPKVLSHIATYAGLIGDILTVLPLEYLESAWGVNNLENPIKFWNGLVIQHASSNYKNICEYIDACFDEYRLGTKSELINPIYISEEIEKYRVE